MFLLYLAQLILFAYFLPALAVYPGLALHPRLFSLVPVISALIIYLCVSCLLYLGLYTQSAVIALSVIFLITAAFRLRIVCQQQANYWSRQSVYIYVLHALLLLPFFIKLATHAFDRGDEIYSWNFWAIQHYLSIPIDISHTGAPYPQLLPKLLSYCYHLLGDLQLQLPVKALLIFFPYMMLNAVATLISFRSKRSVLLYAISLGFVLFGCNYAQFLDDGYADPIMTAAIVISLLCFFQCARWFKIKVRCYYQSNSEERFKRAERVMHLYAFLAVITAIASFLAKQPGLLWAGGLSLMLMLLWLEQPVKSRTDTLFTLGLLLLLGSAVLIWTSTEGSQFQANHGVIGLSKGDRGLVAQLWYGIYRYLISQPSVLILLVFAFWMSYSHKALQRIMWFLVLPGMVLWFLFGAYQLRLGQQYLMVCWFVLVASQFYLTGKRHRAFLGAIDNKLELFGNALFTYPRLLILILCASSAVVSFALWYKVSYIEQRGVRLYDGGRVSLTRYFGRDADWIYTHLYQNSAIKLWVPSRYLYGLFYPGTPLTSPDYAGVERYDEQALVKELLHKKPDYVFTVSQAIIDGPASAVLERVIAAHPQAFRVVAEAPNRYHFVTYRFYPDQL